jgi:hypothetical protein
MMYLPRSKSRKTAILRRHRRRFLPYAALLAASAAALLSAPGAAQTQGGAAPVADDGLSDYHRALKCLTQAIAFEAGYEPLSGQEAVAQVVLNRVRHDAYPGTVCGVVYQGSQRRTGCQFTFTCDGSLRRGIAAAVLAQAQQVAERVLTGHAATAVGGATHYHADYVSPYWAPSLVRVNKIGAHIFYRMPGAPDTPAIVTALNLTGEPQVADTRVRGTGTGAGSERASPNSARRQLFAPWGLPVLSVDKNGKVKPAE